MRPDGRRTRLAAGSSAAARPAAAWKGSSQGSGSSACGPEVATTGGLLRPSSREAPHQGTITSIADPDPPVASTRVRAPARLRQTPRGGCHEEDRDVRATRRRGARARGRTDSARAGAATRAGQAAATSAHVNDAETPGFTLEFFADGNLYSAATARCSDAPAARALGVDRYRRRRRKNRLRRPHHLGRANLFSARVQGPEAHPGHVREHRVRREQAIRSCATASSSGPRTGSR